MGNEGKRALVYLFSFVFHPSLPYILLDTQGGDGGDGGNGGTGGNGGNIYLYSNDSRLFVCIFFTTFLGNPYSLPQPDACSYRELTGSTWSGRIPWPWWTWRQRRF